MPVDARHKEQVAAGDGEVGDPACRGERLSPAFGAVRGGDSVELTSHGCDVERLTCDHRCGPDSRAKAFGRRPALCVCAIVLVPGIEAVLCTSEEEPVAS